MSATKTIGSAPSPRNASYSSVPATTTPMTPPKNAAVTSADAGTCQRPVRAWAKVRNASGTTVAPEQQQRRHEVGVLRPHQRAQHDDVESQADDEHAQPRPPTG